MMSVLNIKENKMSSLREKHLEEKHSSGQADVELAGVQLCTNDYLTSRTD
jgi:hypothetical protein